MRKILFLVITIVILIPCQAKNTNQKDCFYVINILGAELFEKPSLDSKILTVINVGEKVIAKKVVKTDQSKVVGVGFSFCGNFIKIKSSKCSGYLFSSDLTQLKPSLVEVDKGLFVANIFGVEKDYKEEKKKVMYGAIELDVTEQTTEYENCKYKVTMQDGCFDHFYFLKNVSLSEAYHQMTNKYYIINYTTPHKIEIPKFLLKDGNEFHFEEEGAAQNLRIIANEDRTFTISSYDCD